MIKSIYISILLIIFSCEVNSITSSSEELEGCTDLSACNYNSSAVVDDNSCLQVDSCGICGGTANSNDNCSNIWNVFYDSDSPIAGFEFTVEGVTIINVLGGDAQAAGMSISFNSQNGKVLGFSFAGTSVSAAINQILVSFEIQGNTNNACLRDDIIISSTGGVAMEVEVVDCQIIKI